MKVRGKDKTFENREQDFFPDKRAKRA